MTTFKIFTLGSLFEINNGRRVTKDKQIKGKTPYVTAVTTNNGVDTYIGNPPFIENNILTVNFFGNTYYHPYDVSYKDGTYGLKLLNKSYRTKGIYLYLLTVIEKTTLNMGSYSKMLTGNIMFDTEVKLPVKSLKDTEPDWDYMEQYIKQIEKKAILLVKEQNEKDIVLLKELVGQDEGSDISEDVELVPLKVGDIFNINTGGDLILGKTTEGKIPVVSHQNSNNGVSKRVSKIFERTIFDCKTTIALADRGTFFASVQQEDFYIGTRVKALSIKNKDIVTKNILLYLATSINKHSVIFEKYSDNATSKLPELEIYLPVNKNASELVPDWTTIEEYMKHIQQKYILLKEQNNIEELNNLLSVTGLTHDSLALDSKDLVLDQILETLISWEFMESQIAKIELDLKIKLSEKLSLMIA